MERKTRRFRDAVIFQVADSPSEGGLLVDARLKVWGRANLNNEIFDKNAYDDFLNQYYRKNDLNMPLTLQHGGRVEDIVGKIVSIDKDDEGLVVKAQVLEGLPMSEATKTLIANGVLQGMSDEGWSDDFEISDKGEFLIHRATILAVSLVATPAEAIAKVRTVNNSINMRGFEFSNEKSGRGRLRDRRRRE